MTSLSEIDMSFEECLSTAKARLVMVAFVNFHDPSNEDVMKLMQKISKANKRIVVMAVDASKNMTLAQHFNVTMYPTFIFFRNRVVLGSRITMNQAKLLKDIEKYNKVFVSVRTIRNVRYLEAPYIRREKPDLCKQLDHVVNLQ